MLSFFLSAFLPFFCFTPTPLRAIHVPIPSTLTRGLLHVFVPCAGSGGKGVRFVPAVEKDNGAAPVLCAHSRTFHVIRQLLAHRHCISDQRATDRQQRVKQIREMWSAEQQGEGRKVALSGYLSTIFDGFTGFSYFLLLLHLPPFYIFLSLALPSPSSRFILS